MLLSWSRRFDRAWPRLQAGHGERFHRMWTYCLLGSAGSFHARTQQLWQLVLSKGGAPGYSRVS